MKGNLAPMISNVWAVTAGGILPSSAQLTHFVVSATAWVIRRLLVPRPNVSSAKNYVTLVSLVLGNESGLKNALIF